MPTIITIYFTYFYELSLLFSVTRSVCVRLSVYSLLHGRRQKLKNDSIWKHLNSGAQFKIYPEVTSLWLFCILCINQLLRKRISWQILNYFYGLTPNTLVFSSVPQKLEAKSLIKLNFAKNNDGKYACVECTLTIKDSCH